MPVYDIEHPTTGQKIRLEGDGVPTDADIREAFNFVSKAKPKTLSATEHKSARDKFVEDTGTFGTQVKEKALDVARDAMPYVRPVVEGLAAGGGGIGGGVLGAAGGGIGAIPGAVVGAALGYAGAKNVMDNVDNALGTRQVETGGQLAMTTARDLLAGGTMEAGGQVAGKVAGKVLAPVAGYVAPKIANAYRSARTALSDVTPALSKQGIRNAAGKILNENTGRSALYDANAAAADQVAADVPGFRASLGEARNDPGLIKLQRGMERMDGSKAADLLQQKNAANRQALTAHMDDAFPSGTGSIDDTLGHVADQKSAVEFGVQDTGGAAQRAAAGLRPADAQTTGGRVLNALETAIEPVKAAEREAWKKVPNYPIPSSNFDAAANNLRNTPMEADTEAAVKKLLDFADRMPKTTEGMQSIERTIGDKMYAPNADPNTKRVLGQLKKAIGEDFKAMGDAADAGDIALLDGVVVHPSKLKEEASTLTARIAETSTAKAAEPDVQAIAVALRDAGDPPNLWMKQVNERPQGYAQRLAERYQLKIGKPAPMLAAADSPLTAGWKDRLAQLTDQLTKLQPADDVASAYRAAKDVSKARFDQFGRGAVNDVLKSGNQASGYALQDSAIARKFLQPENAAGLINAIGKDEAAAAMKGQFADDLLAKVSNPQTGELIPGKLAAWVKQHGAALDRYGIRGQFDNINAAHASLEAAKQAETAFSKTVAAKMLNADPQKAVAAAMSGAEGLSAKNTGQIMAKLMDQVQGNPQAITGLENGFKDFIIDLVETTKKTIAGDNAISPASIQKALAKYEPAMQVLYRNSPQKLAALKNIQNAVEIQGRSASSPLGGGSDTGEIQAVHKALGFIIDKVPFVGATAKLTKVGLSALKDLNAKEVNELVAKALYDPELAKTLMMAAKGQAPEEVARRMKSYLANYITAGAASVAATHQGPGI